MYGGSIVIWDGYYRHFTTVVEVAPITYFNVM